MKNHTLLYLFLVLGTWHNISHTNTHSDTTEKLPNLIKSNGNDTLLSDNKAKTDTDNVDQILKKIYDAQQSEEQKDVPIISDEEHALLKKQTGLVFKKIDPSQNSEQKESKNVQLNRQELQLLDFHYKQQQVKLQFVLESAKQQQEQAESEMYELQTAALNHKKKARHLKKQAQDNEKTISYLNESKIKQYLNQIENNLEANKIKGLKNIGNTLYKGILKQAQNPKDTRVINGMLAITANINPILQEKINNSSLSDEKKEIFAAINNGTVKSIKNYLLNQQAINTAKVFGLQDNSLVKITGFDKAQPNMYAFILSDVLTNILLNKLSNSKRGQEILEGIGLDPTQSSLIFYFAGKQINNKLAPFIETAAKTSSPYIKSGLQNIANPIVTTVAPYAKPLVGSTVVNGGMKLALKNAKKAINASKTTMHYAGVAAQEMFPPLALSYLICQAQKNTKTGKKFTKKTGLDQLPKWAQYVVISLYTTGVWFGTKALANVATTILTDIVPVPIIFNIA